jgi:hypothetical protein
MSASLLLSKIIDFNDAKQSRRAKRVIRMNANGTEKREYRRTRSKDRMFVQVVSCEENPDLVGTTLSCNALDVSVGGIRINAYDHIPVGSRLDLWVDINSRPGKFFLTSDVRWVENTKHTTASYEIGVELQDGTATDIQEWRHIHQ